MPVYDLDAGDAAAAIAEPDHTGVRFHADDDLPEIGAPGRHHVFVVGKDGFDVSDLHG